MKESRLEAALSAHRSCALIKPPFCTGEKEKKRQNPKTWKSQAFGSQSHDCRGDPKIHVLFLSSQHFLYHHPFLWRRPLLLSWHGRTAYPSTVSLALCSLTRGLPNSDHPCPDVATMSFPNLQRIKCSTVKKKEEKTDHWRHSVSEENEHLDVRDEVDRQ